MSVEFNESNDQFNTNMSTSRRSSSQMSLIHWIVRHKLAKNEFQARTAVLGIASLLLLVSLAIFTEEAFIKDRKIPYENLPKKVRASYPQFIQNLHVQK